MTPQEAWLTCQTGLKVLHSPVVVHLFPVSVLTCTAVLVPELPSHKKWSTCAGEDAAALAAARAWVARASAWVAASQDRLGVLVVNGCLPSQWGAYARAAADKLQGIEHVRSALLRSAGDFGWGGPVVGSLHDTAIKRSSSTCPLHRHPHTKCSSALVEARAVAP